MESNYINVLEEVYTEFEQTFQIVKNDDNMYIRTLSNNGGWSQFEKGWRNAEGKQFKELIEKSKSSEEMIENLRLWSENKLIKNIDKETKKKFNRFTLLNMRTGQKKNQEFRKIFYEIYIEKAKDKGLI